LAQTQRLFLEAILKGQRKAATNLALETLKDGHTISDVYIDIFQESQYQIGRLWETNKITVAEEHMATAITQYVIAQVYPLIESADTVRGKMVVTGVEGEIHQIGANMVADVLESVGWDVRFLGTNMPHQGILRAVEEHGAGAIGISTTMLFNVPKAIHLVSSLRDRFGTENLRIIVGGAVFRSAPELYLEIGADDYAPDLRAILAMT
jgi:methanogenic corrinoid protein MtbC1